MSYARDIVPLVQTYCNVCHSGASAGVDMSDLTTISQNTSNGRIQGAMSGDPNYKTMAPSGNLVDACYVAKINKWVAAGATDN